MPPKKKHTFTKAERQAVWNKHFGEKCGRHKCYVSWCRNHITTFDFDVGHNKPESKGGSSKLSNLRPICHNCNLSMGNRYTIEQWSAMHDPGAKKGLLRRAWDYVVGS